MKNVFDRLDMSHFGLYLLESGFWATTTIAIAATKKPQSPCWKAIVKHNKHNWVESGFIERERVNQGNRLHLWLKG